MAASVLALLRCAIPTWRHVSSRCKAFESIELDGDGVCSRRIESGASAFLAIDMN